MSIAVCASRWAGAASASGLTAHGQLLHLVPELHLNANQSNNWFGYNQGALEQGSKLFNSISGQWTVPAATQHTAGQAEASSDWIGIGGGCVDAGCTVTDSTLIQTGTEQDVSASGAAVLLGLVGARTGAVDHDHQHDGQARRPHVGLGGRGRGRQQTLWKITLSDVTRGESFTTTVPYPSTHGYGRVDRGDAAGDRHQRRPRRAART